MVHFEHWLQQQDYDINMQIIYAEAEVAKIRQQREVNKWRLEIAKIRHQRKVNKWRQRLQRLGIRER